MFHLLSAFRAIQSISSEIEPFAHSIPLRYLFVADTQRSVLLIPHVLQAKNDRRPHSKVFQSSRISQQFANRKTRLQTPIRRELYFW